MLLLILCHITCPKLLWEGLLQWFFSGLSLRKKRKNSPPESAVGSLFDLKKKMKKHSEESFGLSVWKELPSPRVVVSPGTHLVKNHKSYSRTIDSQFKKWVLNWKSLGLYVTRKLLNLKTDSETLFTVYCSKLKYSPSI